MRTYADSQKTVLDTLNSLNLREFDWDGTGGLPVRADAAETVEALFMFSDALGLTLLLGLPDPEVSADAAGTVEVAFEDGKTGRKLLFTFECRGVISYIQVFEDEQTTVDGVIRIDVDRLPASDLVEIIELLNWLISE